MENKRQGPTRERAVGQVILRPFVLDWLDYLPCSSPQQQDHQYWSTHNDSIYLSNLGYWKCCSISDTDQVLILPRYQVCVDRWLTVRSLISDSSIYGIQSSTLKSLPNIVINICTSSGIFSFSFSLPSFYPCPPFPPLILSLSLFLSLSVEM